MNPVFLDTVGLIALWDPADQWHQAASASFSQLLLNGAALFTSEPVLWECANALARTTTADASHSSTAR